MAGLSMSRVQGAQGGGAPGGGPGGGGGGKTWGVQDFKEDAFDTTYVHNPNDVPMRVCDLCKGTDADASELAAAAWDPKSIAEQVCSNIDDNGHWLRLPLTVAKGRTGVWVHWACAYYSPLVSLPEKNAILFCQNVLRSTMYYSTIPSPTANSFGLGPPGRVVKVVQRHQRDLPRPPPGLQRVRQERGYNRVHL